MKKGFTLIEILVYIAILSIVGGAILFGILKLVDFYNISRFDKEVLMNAHLALNKISGEAKYASSIYLPTSTANSQISFETSLNPPTDEDETYVDFYLDGGRLCLKRESEDVQILTSEKVEVTSLNFGYLASPTHPSSIKTTITVRYKTSKEKYQREKTLTSLSTLRGEY